MERKDFLRTGPGLIGVGSLLLAYGNKRNAEESTGTDKADLEIFLLKLRDGVSIINYIL